MLINWLTGANEAADPLRCRRGQGPHLAKRWDPRGFARVAAAFSSYDGVLMCCLVLTKIYYAKESHEDFVPHNQERFELVGLG